MRPAVSFRPLRHRAARRLCRRYGRGGSQRQTGRPRGPLRALRHGATAARLCLRRTRHIGATIGTWTWRVHGEERQQSARFSAAYSTVDLPLIARPAPSSCRTNGGIHPRAGAGRRAGDPIAARDQRQRCRRAGRIPGCPRGPSFQLAARWAMPYGSLPCRALQWPAEALRRRFPAPSSRSRPLPAIRVAYLLTRAAMHGLPEVPSRIRLPAAY